MIIPSANLPPFIRRDGVIWIQSCVDAMTSDADRRGFEVYISRNRIACVEVPKDRRCHIPPPSLLEDYVLDFLVRSLLDNGITRRSHLFDKVTRHVRKIKDHMKNTIPQTVEGSSPIEWIEKDHESALSKSEIWEVARYCFGWPDGTKKDFFNAYFSECPNGVPVRKCGQVVRGFKGVRLSKIADMKIRIVRRNKKIGGIQ